MISPSASNSQLDNVSAHEDSTGASFVEQRLDEMKCTEHEVKETNVASSVLELISFADMDSAADDGATPHGIVAEEDSRGTSKGDNFTTTAAQAVSNSENSPVTANGKSVEENQQFSDNISHVPNLLDLGEAYKLVVANRGKQFSGLLVEQWLSKDSSKVSQDLRTAEASSSNAFQSIQKMISLERNESGLSVDGSVVSEIEGETVMDRLKRQIEHNRKAMTGLYKELEEERNSSAISVNQAMAMITRLQEEKATLQMEALQYLRMMEEQAEYHMEALQKTNDLLSEREKEIQDLEAELEFFRKKHTNESPSGIMTEAVQAENSHEITENIERDKTSTKADASDASGEVRTGILKNAAVKIEEEKLHVLSCLEKLEEKLAFSSKHRDDMDLAKGDHPKVEAEVQHEPQESTCKGDLLGDCADDECGSAEQIDSSGQGNPCTTRQGAAIDDESPNQRHDDDNDMGKFSPFLTKGVEITSLKKEYWQLLERMEALESDHRFLENTINCLQIGEEGLQFFQDIASHLRELRAAETRDN